ncbi:alpha/beta fold hydrolase [Egibacter rhizosphaerae]|uniref:Alpha/beta fold hydrolase n=1 Tax=Egibacter rhizosphaerae TaxID=1670831 RepID=A0A411YFB7_9ACTN|nr:alpha/beta fold hydrolase [Egibacter rhizosphaerae]QBI19876.1 alpha/beta fold hydrolase [Egibacter rhizosphaerae]
MYFLAGVPTALEHGYNVVLFHAPGQRGVLHRDPTQVFRPDSEMPIGAVIEDVADRQWAEADRTALYGLSFGGYHVLRAAARLDRVAAVIASAPLPDLFETLLDTAAERAPGPLGPWLRDPLDRLSPQAWSRIVAPARRANWAIDNMIDGYMMWTSGAQSPGEAITGLRRFRLGALETEITVPVLSLWSEGEGEAVRRRAEALQRTAPAPTTLTHLVAADGADGHCGVGNVVHTAGLVYDWLDRTLSHQANEPAPALTPSP